MTCKSPDYTIIEVAVQSIKYLIFTPFNSLKLSKMKPKQLHITKNSPIKKKSIHSVKAKFRLVAERRWVKLKFLITGFFIVMSLMTLLKITNKLK